MKIRILAFALALALLAALGGCGSGDGPAAGAPAEDERLVVYTSHKEEVWRPIVLEFEQRTGIWVDVVTGGTNELLERIAAESAEPKADVMFGGGVDSIEVYSDFLEPYVSPEAGMISARCRSESGVWTPFSLLPVVLIYNTQLISPGTLSSWDDLFNSAFRGKIAFADPSVSGSSFTALMTMLLAVGGERNDALRRFAENLGGLELAGSGDVLTYVANGSCWFGVTLEETALKRVEAGDSVALVYPDDGTSLVPDGSALVKGAPHADNARLFIDFTISRDVQELLGGQFRRSVRRDVGSGGLRPLSELEVLDYDVERASSEHDTVLMSWEFFLEREDGQ